MNGMRGFLTGGIMGAAAALLEPSGRDEARRRREAEPDAGHGAWNRQANRRRKAKRKNQRSARKATRRACR